MEWRPSCYALITQASGPEFNPWKPYLGGRKKWTPPSYRLTSPSVLWSVHTHAHTYKCGGECMGGRCAHALPCMWRSEDNMRDWCCPCQQTRVMRLGHLATPLRRLCKYWRDGSVVRGTGCPCREPGLGSQLPFTATCDSSSKGCNALFRPSWAPDTHDAQACMQAKKPIHIKK